MKSIFVAAIKGNLAYANLYYQQKAEQKEYIDLKPLFDAYEAFMYHYFISADFNEIFLALGKAQRVYLPMHMLKEMSWDKYTWQDDVKLFQLYRSPLAESHLLKMCNGGGASIELSRKNISLLGEKFALFRGNGQNNSWCPEMCVMITMLEAGKVLSERNHPAAHDYTQLQNLYLARIFNLSDPVELLENPAAKHVITLSR